MKNEVDDLRGHGSVEFSEKMLHRENAILR
jgi:hypothetical protein